MAEYDIRELVSRKEIQLIAAIAERFRVEAYLVGGCIRDHLLGREIRDLDFALSGACRELPAAFAERVSGRFFWLDEGRQQARVVLKGVDGNTFYDFAPLAGLNIEDDLRHRDFTINAIAMPLQGFKAELIDPLHGRNDLRNRVIRTCSPASFLDDPLRLMRAIRFSAELGFTIQERTWNDLCGKASLLRRAAFERIRDELFRILDVSGCVAYLLKLVESGLWREISPLIEIRPEGMASTVEEVERLYAESVLGKFLDREIESGVTVLSLAKLAVFLGKFEKDSSDNLAARLRLGREAGRILGLLRCEDGRIYELLERIGTERATFRFFRDREPAGLWAIIVARARGEISETVFESLSEYFTKSYDPGGGDLLLSGGEVMEILGIPPGKVVGTALDRLREAEASGTVNNTEEARLFIKNLLTSKASMR